jgi:hypothetical protein
MRTLVLLTTVLAMAPALVRAESIYRYYDPHTKREVFVNQLDQVPAPQREQAERIVKDGLLVGASGSPDKDTQPGSVIFGTNESAGLLAVFKQALNEASDGTAIEKVERLVTMLMDTRLVNAGKRPLSAANVVEVVRMLGLAVLALLAASLIATVALILVVVHAFRNSHPVWGFLLLFLPPLGIPYVLVHVERRLFKYPTLLGQCAPFVVILVAVWRFYDFFTTVMAARSVG